MRKLGTTLPPKTVIWESTLACNMSCIHCGSATRNPPGNELSTAEITGFVRDLARLGVMRFLATGGEPLLRADLPGVLQAAGDAGMETGLSTNGSLVSQDNIDLIVRAADSVQVSVDGIGRTHDSLRQVGGAYDGAVNALQLLKKNGCRQTCMTSIISPFNIDELEDLYRAARANADLWRVGTVMPVGRARENDSLFLSDDQLRSLLDFLAGRKQESFPVIIGENLGFLGEYYDRRIYGDDFFFCGIGTVSCCIGADGRIRGCPELPPDEENIVGDLRKERFEEIWERGFIRFREPQLLPVAAGCRECTDLEVCRGGCSVMRLKGMECTRNRVERPAR